MYKKKTLIYKIVLIVFACLVFVFPARDNPSIGDKALVSVMALDSKGEELIMTIELIVATQKKEGGAELLTINSTGADCPEALANLAKMSGTEMELSHCGVMIIGEQLSKKGFSEHLDYLLSAGYISPQITLLTCDGEATEFMEKLNEFSMVNGSGLNDVINFSDKSAFVKVTSALNFLSETNLPSSSCTVPIVAFDGKAYGGISGNGDGGGNSKAPMLAPIERAALFKNGVRVGKLSEEATKGITVFDSKSDSGFFEISDIVLDEEKIDSVPTEIRNKSFSLKADLGDAPTVTIEVGFVLETQTRAAVARADKDINDAKIKKAMQKRADEMVKERIESALTECRSFDCDALGLQNDFYKQCGKQYKFYGNKEDLLHNVQIKYKINTKIV